MYRLARPSVWPLRRAPLPLLVGLLLLGGVLPHAEARRCGDDVDGRGTAVRCACGDVVVSDVRLRADDPVATAPCATDGLVVDADTAITVRFDGVVLRGAGRGTGVRVLRGGGALEGPGGVEGFDVGVSALPGALARAVGVSARANRRDGFLVRDAETVLVDCISEGNGRSGVRRTSAAPEVDGGHIADNARDQRRRARRVRRERP